MIMISLYLVDKLQRTHNAMVVINKLSEPMPMLIFFITTNI